MMITNKNKDYMEPSDGLESEVNLTDDSILTINQYAKQQQDFSLSLLCSSNII